MSIFTFESLVSMNRNAFRNILVNNLKEVCYEGEIIDFKEWIIRECFGACGSEFEEQTMAENLKEEFELFLKEIGE